MAESINEFFTEGDFKTSGISAQAKTIQDFLASAETSPKVAAENLISEYQAQKASKFERVVAEIILPLAEQRPETHEALVKLLGELNVLVQTIPGGLKEGDKTSLNYELWERGLRYGDPEPSNALSDLYRQEWTNVNHFAALAFEASLEDLSAFGEKTLELSIRRGGWRVNWDGQGENPSDKIEALQGHIDAASQWILVAGKRLYTNSGNVQKQWTQWEKDLAWISEQDGLKDGSKSLAQKALAEMKTIKAQ